MIHSSHNMAPRPYAGNAKDLMCRNCYLCTCHNKFGLERECSRIGLPVVTADPIPKNPFTQFDSKKITQVPITFNWDMTNVIGTATIYGDGKVIIEIIPSKRTEPLYEKSREGSLRGFSLGFSFEQTEEKKDG